MKSFAATAAPVDGVETLLGNTPLIRLDRLAGAGSATVWAKWEAANPGGSIKARPAALMLREALRSGEVRAGGTVVESSSGNLGVALAQLCRLHDLRFICVVDPRINDSTRRLIQAYGATIRMVEQPDPETGDFLAARLAEVRRILDREPGAWWPNQYANPFNARSHEDGTVREIFEALDGRVDALFVATSSTGTIVGCSDYLRNHSPATTLVAVDAAGSVLFGGNRGDRRLPGMGAGTVPPLAQHARPDAIVRVSDLDCVVGCRRLVRDEALMAGASSGGVISALSREVHRFGPGKNVVVVLADSGERYLHSVYDDEWVADNLDCDARQLGQLLEQPGVSAVA